MENTNVKTNVAAENNTTEQKVSLGTRIRNKVKNADKKRIALALLRTLEGVGLFVGGVAVGKRLSERNVPICVEGTVEESENDIPEEADEEEEA